MSSMSYPSRMLASHLLNLVLMYAGPFSKVPISRELVGYAVEDWLMKELEKTYPEDVDSRKESVEEALEAHSAVLDKIYRACKERSPYALSLLRCSQTYQQFMMEILHLCEEIVGSTAEEQVIQQFTISIFPRFRHTGIAIWSGNSRLNYVDGVLTRGITSPDKVARCLKNIWDDFLAYENSRISHVIIGEPHSPKDHACAGAYSMLWQDAPVTWVPALEWSGGCSSQDLKEKILDPLQPYERRWVKDSTATDETWWAVGVGLHVLGKNRLQSE